MTDLELFAAAPLALSVDESTLGLIREAESPNTQRAYRRWAVRFDTWCQQHGRTALPATGETLADWLADLAAGGVARSTLGQAMSAVRKAHELAGRKGEPDLTLPTRVVKGHTKRLASAGRRAKQAPPATVPVLLAMIGTLDDTKAGDLRDHLLLVLGWSMFARRSELADLRLEDIDEAPEGLVAWVRESKTDKTGDGRTVKIVAQPHPDLDPVRLLARWRERLGRHGITDGPVLRQVRKGRGGVLLDPMSDDAVHRVVRKLAVRAKVPRAAEFTGHSLRAGAATQALQDGATMQAVCRAGGWVDGSAAVALYSRGLEEWRDHPLRNIRIGR